MKKLEAFKPWILLVAIINADLALALLYNHLAGGKTIAYLFTIIWLPITAFIFGICFVFTRLDMRAILSVKAMKIRFLKTDWQHRLWNISFLIYAFLPVILNSLSKLTDNQALASFLFNSRYWSLLFFGSIYLFYKFITEKRWFARFQS